MFSRTLDKKFWLPPYQARWVILRISCISSVLRGILFSHFGIAETAKQLRSNTNLQLELAAFSFLAVPRNHGAAWPDSDEMKQDRGDTAVCTVCDVCETHGDPSGQLGSFSALRRRPISGISVFPHHPARRLAVNKKFLIIKILSDFSPDSEKSVESETGLLSCQEGHKCRLPSFVLSDGLKWEKRCEKLRE